MKFCYKRICEQINNESNKGGRDWNIKHPILAGIRDSKNLVVKFIPLTCNSHNRFNGNWRHLEIGIFSYQWSLLVHYTYEYWCVNRKESGVFSYCDKWHANWRKFVSIEFIIDDFEIFFACIILFLMKFSSTMINYTATLSAKFYCDQTNSSSFIKK